MTLRQLEVFLAVAREKSFSRAAKRIHSSQPTLSEHISELEGELGKKLFFRRGREVTMTEAGRVFEQYAAGAVSAVEGARQALGDLDGLAHGALDRRQHDTRALRDAGDRRGVPHPVPRRGAEAPDRQLAGHRGASEGA